MTDSVAAPVQPLSLAQPDAVTIEGVDMQFDGLVVLRDIQLQIPGGSAVAVVGPNGSGKTTLLNIISGIYRPAAGKVIIGGRDVTGYRPHRVARLGVGRTFQHNEMPKELPVLRVVMLGRHTKMKAGVFSYTFGIPYFAKEERRNSEAARAALRLVGLENLARAAGRATCRMAWPSASTWRAPWPPSRKCYCSTSRAAGLNDKEREDLLDLLRRVKQERQLTLVVVEHDMSFIASLCERVVVLVSGSKVYDGDSASMHEDAAVVEALLGTTVPASSARQLGPGQLERDRHGGIPHRHVGERLDYLFAEHREVLFHRLDVHARPLGPDDDRIHRKLRGQGRKLLADAIRGAGDRGRDLRAGGARE